MIPKNNEIRFEICTSCNYNCCICARDKLTRKKEIMPTEKFKFYLQQILDATGQYDTLTFSGFGEPLLDKDILEKIKFARKCNLKVLLLTNGSLLTKEIFEKMEDLEVESIRVSFYGITGTTYSKVHGVDGGYFEKTYKNLTDLCRSKRRVKILMTYNIVEGINDQDTSAWVKYWEPISDLVEIWKPHNWVYGRSYRKVQKEKVETCGRPWNTPLQVQVDGTINMCCFDFNGDLLVGDLNKQSLEEIFKSGMYKKIVSCHASGNFEGSGLICENCDQRNEDKAGVLAYSSKFNPEDRIGRVSTTYSKLS
jgi:wyosine [tRNA(Phe)-imidazoG37] synthetase (radical SAM superfamily)